MAAYHYRSFRQLMVVLTAVATAAALAVILVMFM